jgi:hypothetical protein
MDTQKIPVIGHVMFVVRELGREIAFCLILERSGYMEDTVG